MELKFNYYSNVSEEGKLQKNVSQKIAEELKFFKGKRVEIQVKKLSSKRTSRQNRLWWLYMTILANEVGYTKDEMHDICKFKFLKREKIDEKSGEVFEYIANSSSLTKSEFSDLTTDLIRWASQTFSVILPLPDEQIEIFE